VISKKQAACISLLSVGYFLGLFFGPENGSSMFFRIAIELLQDCAASHATK
jgi:hypothetical protein